MIVRLFLVLLLAAGASLRAQRISPLANAPDWAELEQFQATITRQDFVRLLNDVYAPRDAAIGLIEVRAEAALIRKTLAPPEVFTLRFAHDAGSARKPPRVWRAAAELGAASPDQPLAGVKIALDPGHLGGEWARTEGRWFRIGEGVPVTEGDMTLRVAEHLAPQLRELGAKVSFVRAAPGATTLTRPPMLLDVAEAELAVQGAPADAPDKLERAKAVQNQSELLFYRAAEIRHRGDRVNRILRPDLTVCLHFNAEAWGDPRKPSFVPRNHLHVLVNGCYSASELRHDDVRFEMLIKLLERSFPEEQAASERVAAAMAAATGLLPYKYTGASAKQTGSSPYVWARNLLANRVYRTPVVFLEPYVMNSEEVWERVQAGDYHGVKVVAGVSRKSIYREYADGVAEGLRAHFTAARGVQ